MAHAIFINGSLRATVIQPASSTWRPSRGNVAWRVRDVPDDFNGAMVQSVMDLQKYPTVDYYCPPTLEKRKPTTPYEGSWAHTMSARTPRR